MLMQMKVKSQVLDAECIEQAHNAFTMLHVWDGPVIIQGQSLPRLYIALILPSNLLHFKIEDTKAAILASHVVKTSAKCITCRIVNTIQACQIDGSIWGFMYTCIQAPSSKSPACPYAADWRLCTGHFVWHGQ